MTFEPIAIVGRACVLPGALTPDALWEAVRAGRDLVTPVPPGRWRRSPARALGGGPDRACTDRGGYVSGFEGVFDPSGFALRAEEIARLDPQVRWLLHVSRAALREARLEGGPRVGAVLGNLSFPTASSARFAERTWLGDALAEAAGIPAADARSRFSSGLPAHLVAAALGLGEAFCLDAACASSLYAIKLACDRLHDRSADAMLAGAVTCCDDLFIHTGFTALQALSPSGRSRPFHRGADGLVPAEGAGVVVLERLADAVAAKHRIFGVIRGVGLSNDGRGAGLVAPSEDGQVRAMRAAYDQSGLSPADVSLVECHATGTAVGDRVEIRGLRRVFEGCSGLPIGSLKSNFGHAVAAAGVAGLIKVLGAIEARERPPTLHADEPLDDLSHSPLRLLSSAEPWPSDGPRRAAVSAFGFGGCNAHLIVQEHVPAAKVRPVSAPPVEQAELAIVGLGALVGDGSSTADFAKTLSEAPAPHHRATSLHLEISATRFPPRDLERTLPQQTWLLAATHEALTGLQVPPRDRLGVYVGMGCDPEIARYGARWRTRDWAQSLEISDEAWSRKLEDTFIAPLDASGVLGTLPNLPANRLNFQFDLGGPGFTVSAEEISGLRALEVAANALRQGEIDLALVGSSDFTSEVHEAACRAAGIDTQSGDAAVVLAVQRAADAKRDGRPILALLDFAEGGKPFSPADVEARFGRAHAAFGLVQVAAATVECSQKSRDLRVAVEAMGGQHAAVRVRSYQPAKAGFVNSGATSVAGNPASATTTPPKQPTATTTLAVTTASPSASVATYPAHRATPRIPDLPSSDDPWLGVVALEPKGPQKMAPAPALPPVLDLDDAPETPRSSPAAPAPASAAGPARPDVAQWIAEQQGALARAHKQFVESQARAQQQFLALREQVNRRLLDLAGRGGPSTSGSRCSPGAGPERSRGARADGTPPAVVAPAPPSFPGPKLDRRGLEIHASGKISEIYGPLFEKQDGFARQVRMPEPPLLLADRLLGIEAEPGTMGKGRLWTETDVAPDGWYLHDGRMPAGILIESGQADLMLISYLGVDFLNRGDRVYRLLGCDLTYHGSLPAPGGTLRYEIHVDDHASQGDVRLFFFHYDCVAQNLGAGTPAAPQLSVRNGQAGFFTDQELADSAGVLWDAATGEHAKDARVDPPAVACQATRLDRARLEDFARGRADLCFGKGFEFGATHTRSPRISGGKMLLLDEVTELSQSGGPWGRGYLRAIDRLSPDDWFFEGHFKNDPCMPGTLMFEGCLQAMAVYVTSLGYTLDKDGWRFEPVPEQTYKLRCRGQATPKSKELVYEVFVEGIEAGPEPTLWADLLCTVDGLKAFHCRRMGLRLVPGWPLDSLPEARTLVDTKPVASARGFSFGARSMLACAWGKPSEAFGPMYDAFDGPRRVPRLPGPPYLFMSRVTQVSGEIGAMQLGSSVEVEYDVPPDAWYFEANGAPTMPFCVLLEAALQPCGWLASYIGSALESPEDLFFRNLDGTGTLLGEIGPDAGTLITRSKLTQISRSAGMIIVAFDVTCAVRPRNPEPVAGRGSEREVYKLKTVFGFFPKAALAAQVGLPTTDEQRAALTEAPASARDGGPIDLRSRPPRYFDASARLPSEKLQMLHRVAARWPEGGAAKLGRYRSEFDVEPDTWFLRAHFFQDPVQPGSLGLEAMVQLLQLAMIDRGLAQPGDRFEPLALGAPMTWKYRGQVLPRNRRVNVVMDLTKVGEDERGKLAVADASLWVDGMRIYEATGVAMRAVPTPALPDKRGGGYQTHDDEVLSTESSPFLADHRPTWTVPALPLMSMVDRLMRCVERESGATVVAVEDAQVMRWLPIVGSVRLKTEIAPVAPDGAYRATLLAWREAARADLSRFEPVASAVVRVAKEFPRTATEPWTAPADARPLPNPYESGALFHGPAFQRLRKLARGPSGAAAEIEATSDREILLDALTHALPHDSLHEWSAEVPSDLVAYPHRVASLRLFAPLPTSGVVHCLARFVGFDGDDRRHPRFSVQLLDGKKLLATLELVETLFPMGPLGTAEPALRRAFLRDRRFVPGLRLSSERDGVSRLSAAQVRETDWLPGTVAGAFATATDDLAREIAAKEHVAARIATHPSLVQIAGDEARCSLEPLDAWPLRTSMSGEVAEVRDAGPARLDLAPVRAFWDRRFGVGRWPIEDLYYGLAERFVRRVRFASPEVLPAIRGKCVLYLSNHQVAVESLLFSMLLSGLTEVPTITLAKAEHRTSWLGRLIAHSFAWPGVTDPGVITFFQRDDPDELPKVVAQLAGELKAGAHSAMVHVEGTRALGARAPVAKMSGAFLDMALATGTTVVPVRFVGGLPVEPLRERLEFPHGLGRQDVVVGEPIAPAQLAKLNYKERKERVVAAINALMPADEQPFESDSGLSAEADAWMAKTGASHEHAVLLEALRRVADPCEAVRRLLDGVERGRLEVAGDAQGQWLAELARRLFGPRGPKVVGGDRP